MVKNKKTSKNKGNLIEFNSNFFRTELEAKWAVFFVAVEVAYEHELDTYPLSNGLDYIPSFYLPTLDVYAEVTSCEKEEFYTVLSDLVKLTKKGESTSNYPEKQDSKLEKDLLKLRLLYEETETPSVLLDNIPTIKPYLVYDGEWKLCYWETNYFGEHQIEQILLYKDYDTLQEELNNYMHISDIIEASMKIANTSQFEKGYTPDVESISERLDNILSEEAAIIDAQLAAIYKKKRRDELESNN